MKRVILICSLTAVFILVEIITCTCLILDHIFYPSFKKIDPKPPLFIIGMPRSGATLCYSLLASDRETFSSIRLWEILLAPSIIQKKLLIFINKADRLFKRPLYKLVCCFDRYFFRKIEENHPLSLFNHEEDEFIFMHVLSTFSGGFLFPGSKRLIALREFDEKLSESRKRFLMLYYRNCIKRHLFVYGPEKRYLSKSSSNTPKIRTILQFFPGSRFIYLLRDPLYTISSMACLFRKIRDIFHSDIQLEHIIGQIYEIADQWYSYPLETCKELLGKSVFILPFDNLTEDAGKAIQHLYYTTGLNMSPQYLNFLNQSGTLVKGNKSKNKYTSEEFSLEPDVIRKRYDFVYRIANSLQPVSFQI